MDCALASDLQCDAPGSKQTPVLVVVVASVGEEPAGPVSGPSAKAADAGYRVQ